MYILCFVKPVVSLIAKCISSPINFSFPFSDSISEKKKEMLILTYIIFLINKYTNLFQRYKL